MEDPVTAFSTEHNHAPFQRAFRKDKGMYQWYSEPEQASKRHTFGIAMKGSATVIPEKILLECRLLDLCPRESVLMCMPHWQYLTGVVYQTVPLLST